MFWITCHISDGQISILHSIYSTYYVEVHLRYQPTGMCSLLFKTNFCCLASINLGLTIFPKNPRTVLKNRLRLKSFLTGDFPSISTVKDVHFKAAFNESHPVTLVIIDDRCSNHKCLIRPNKCSAIDVSLHNQTHINRIKPRQLRLRYIAVWPYDVTFFFWVEDGVFLPSDPKRHLNIT